MVRAVYDHAVTSKLVAILVALSCATACEKASPTHDKPAPDPTPTPTPPKPKPLDAGTVAPTQTACDVIAMYIGEQGIWVGAPPDVRCFGIRTAGKLDAVWLERELRQVRAATGRCNPSFELAASPNVAYQDVILAMDVALKTGFVDVGLSDPAGLGVAFASSPPASSTRCPQLEDLEPSTAPAAASLPRPTAPRAGLAEAPVIIVTRTEISIVLSPQTTRVLVMTVADAARGAGLIAQLTEAFDKTPAKGLAILQADQRTDAHVINRIVLTSKAAGFDNLLFAVKNR